VTTIIAIVLFVAVEIVVVALVAYHEDLEAGRAGGLPRQATPQRIWGIRTSENFT
jgi:hypothetical protein